MAIPKMSADKRQNFLRGLYSLNDWLDRNVCANGEGTGRYQLIWNRFLLWDGTLAEINEVVKSMILCIENADNYSF